MFIFILAMLRYNNAVLHQYHNKYYCLREEDQYVYYGVRELFILILLHALYFSALFVGHIERLIWALA